MDLEKHFTTYRASLGKDALEGCIEYAKETPTAQTDLYPTVYDYLNLALNNVKTAMVSKNERDYTLWLSRHQAGMTAIFEKMVQRLLPEDRQDITVVHVYDLINKHGWKWFKFCPVSLTMTMELQKKEPEKVALHWVPRYTKQYDGDWKGRPGVPFDADELAQFWTLERTPETTRKVTHPAIEFKRRLPGQKFLKVDIEAGCSCYKPIGEVNSDNTVVDWSLPLF